MTTSWQLTSVLSVCCLQGRCWPWHTHHIHSCCKLWCTIVIHPQGGFAQWDGSKGKDCSL